jgi:hypothetical protein
MRKSTVFLSLLLAPTAMAFVTLPGCSTAPSSEEGKTALRDSSKTALNDMYKADPALKDFKETGYAYAIFPEIATGAAVVGGSYGRGEVFEQGKFIGYADVSAGSFGASLGGAKYAELIIFQDKPTLDKFTSGKLSFEANASAVALKSGVATQYKFNNGIQVVKNPIGGLMVDASIGGQQFSFVAAEVENQ